MVLENVRCQAGIINLFITFRFPLLLHGFSTKVKVRKDFTKIHLAISILIKSIIGILLDMFQFHSIYRRKMSGGIYILQKFSNSKAIQY